jgi:hypothetical protein
VASQSKQLKGQKLDDSNEKSLSKQYQELLGSFNWLSISTRPDITGIVYLLYKLQSEPSPQHMDSAKYVIKYLAATPTTGLYYSTQNNNNLQSFVTFPPQQSLLAFSDANWGPWSPLSRNQMPHPKNNHPPVSDHYQNGWRCMVPRSLSGDVLAIETQHKAHVKPRSTRLMKLPNLSSIYAYFSEKSTSQYNNRFQSTMITKEPYFGPKAQPLKNEIGRSPRELGSRKHQPQNRQCHPRSRKT